MMTDFSFNLRLGVVLDALLLRCTLCHGVPRGKFAGRSIFAMDAAENGLVLRFPTNQEILGVLLGSFKDFPNLHEPSKCRATRILDPGGAEMTWDRDIKEGMRREPTPELSYV